MISSSKGKVVTKSKCRTKKRNIKNLVLSSSSDDECSSSSSEEGDEEKEEAEDKEEEEEGDDDSVHDVSDYLHLVDTLHYDNEYDSVYKSTRVVEEGDYIVVYRKKQLKNGQWAKGECISPIYAKDVVEMTELYSTMDERKK